MSLYATVNDKPHGDVATNSGWADFTKWALSLDGPDELANLASHGWSDDGEQLAADLEAAIESGEPTADQLSIANGLSKIAASMTDGDVLVVTDGVGVEPGCECEPGKPCTCEVRARAPESLELGIRALGDLVPLGNARLAPLDEWRFPELEDAIDWLVNQQAVVSKDELANLQQTLHREAFALNVENVQTVQKIQGAIADSLRSGDSLSEFRTRISDITSVTKARQETLFRTNTKQAYLAGQTRTLEQPRVKERFRWVYYASTKDNRTRPTHFAMDGMVAEVGSSLHSAMLKLQTEYNCRCTLIPLDERKARRFGIKTLADLPREVRAAVA